MRARDGVLQAARTPGALTRDVHLSVGDVPGAEYAMQLFADHLVHAWDLARAVGGESALPDDLVDRCLTWFAGTEDAYRRAGLIAARPPLPHDATAQQHLLAAFGRTS